MAKTPETTIDTLDMGDLCLLTLTNRHLRGNITKLFPNGAKQKEQVDVLLSGLAGYTVAEVSRKMARIQCIVWGSLIGLSGIWFMDVSVGLGILCFVIGVLVALISRLLKDIAVFELNVMGSKTGIPIRIKDADKVRAFITKIQNAKIAYEEENG